MHEKQFEKMRIPKIVVYSSTFFIFSILHLFSMETDEHKLPMLHARDLNGHRRILPDDLPAKKTLLLIAFKRQQQESVDSWIGGLDLNSPHNNISWLELPLLHKGWKWIAPWINQGMRYGITEKKLRAHVVTIYTDRSSFLKAMGLTSTQLIAAVVVDPDGRILETVLGDYSNDKSHILLKTLHSH
jgi:hypothetical protein